MKKLKGFLLFVDLDAQTGRQMPPLGVRAGIESPPLLWVPLSRNISS